jgi:hypothetical protein
MDDPDPMPELPRVTRWRRRRALADPKQRRKLRKVERDLRKTLAKLEAARAWLDRRS